MKLHVFPPSPNAKKVLFVNEQLGLGIPMVTVNLFKGEQNAPEFMALNPNAKMPILEFDDGSTLWESNAISNRLCAETDTSLWPKSNQRYDIMRWQFWEIAHMSPASGKFIQRNLFGNESIDLEAAAVDFHKYATVLNDHLASREWLSGDAMTTADSSVGAILSLRHACQMPMGKYANIESWMQRMEALPAWQAATHSLEQ
jgi:glutathione S-transferase